MLVAPLSWRPPSSSRRARGRRCIRAAYLTGFNPLRSNTSECVKEIRPGTIRLHERVVDFSRRDLVPGQTVRAIHLRSGSGFGLGYFHGRVGMPDLRLPQRVNAYFPSWAGRSARHFRWIWRLQVYLATSSRNNTDTSPPIRTPSARNPFRRLISLFVP